MTLPRIGRRPRPADGLAASPRPTSRRLVRLAIGGALLTALTIAGVWLAILYMPLPASQVIPRVKAAISERLGPAYSVDIEDAELHRGGDGIELRLVDLVIGKTGGPPIATVPRAELRLTGLGLFGGDVGVRSVHVTNPRLDLRFDLAVDAASKNSDLPSRILSAIGDLDRLLGADGAAGALEEVDVTGATLLVAPRSRAPLSLSGVNLRLSRGAGGAIALTTSSSRTDDRWTTALTVSAPALDKARVIDLGIENVDLAPYSAPFAEKAGASPVSGRVSGHLNGRIGPDGKLLAGDARLEGRALQVSMAGGPAGEGEEAKPPSELGLDLFQLAAHWDPIQRTVLIDPSTVRGKGGQMSFEGALVAPSDPSRVWAARLGGHDVLL
ncbi:MAG: preprotein translocase subunit TatC, partial [Hansschlegelia sp.]